MLMVVMLWLILAQQVQAQDNQSKQIDQIKVAYMANFIRFTQWDKDANVKDNQAQPWIITIVGDSAFVKDVSVAFPNGKFLDRPIVLVDLPALRDEDNPIDEQTQKKLLASHVIYLRNSNLRDHRDILSLSSSPDFLYLSDMPGMAKAGGMIELCTLKTRVTFKVNAKAIRNAKIRVSSKVLRLGIPVTSNP